MKLNGNQLSEKGCVMQPSIPLPSHMRTLLMKIARINKTIAPGEDPVRTELIEIVTDAIKADHSECFKQEKPKNIKFQFLDN